MIVIASDQRERSNPLCIVEFGGLLRCFAPSAKRPADRHNDKKLYIWNSRH